MVPPQNNMEKSGLSDEVKLKMRQIAALESKAVNEVGHDAIRWYVDNYEQLQKSHDFGKAVEPSSTIIGAIDNLAAQEASNTARLSTLLVRNILDTNTLLMLLYEQLPESESSNKDDLMEKIYRMALSRMRRKLDPKEVEIASMVSEYR